MNGTYSILIVEDDPTLLRGLKDNFESRGYDVRTATDGKLGLDSALATPPDLIVLDIMLPNMNGYELAEQLRRKHPDTRVLLMSAQPNHPSLGDRRAPPGIELLAKPFEVSELAAKVRSVLEAPPGA